MRLGPKQVEMLEVLSERGGYSTRKLSHKVKAYRNNAAERKLEQYGLIENRGTEISKHWYITEKGSEELERRRNMYRVGGYL